MPEVHARFSPSAAKRRIMCPRSLRLEELFPETESPYAQEGTAGHSLAEWELRQYLNKRKGKRPQSEYYTEELREAVDEYVQYVVDAHKEGLSAWADTRLLVEFRCDLSDYAEGCFGTADAVVISDGAVEIVDLKLGKGVEVSAKENEQLKCYALGVLNAFAPLYEIKEVKMTIVQPRLKNLSSWSLEPDELLDWGENVLKPAAELALKGEGEFRAGEWCRFCKAKATCRARAEANLELARLEFKEPELLSPEEMGQVLDQADEIKHWVEDVYRWAQESAIHKGLKFEGYKLVEGKSMRKYTDTELVEKAALESGYSEIYETSLLGVSAMEKYMGKKKFAEILGELVVKPRGKLCLVKNSDKREEVSAAILDFEIEGE